MFSLWQLLPARVVVIAVCWQASSCCDRVDLLLRPACICMPIMQSSLHQSKATLTNSFFFRKEVFVKLQVMAFGNRSEHVIITSMEMCTIPNLVQTANVVLRYRQAEESEGSIMGWRWWEKDGITYFIILDLFVLMFYAITPVFQIYLGCNMMYKMKRRKPGHTLLPT